MKYVSVKVPNWFRENAVYQINPRTFSKEGTINSITKELPSLKELGFDVIYLCPIFAADDSEDQNFWSKRQKKSQTGNPKNQYRIRNYFNIDEEYGTKEDLICLIDLAHELGMKVLLDLVYMHMGPEADIIKKHPEFAKLDKEGRLVYNEYGFILLDFNSIGLREYLWANMVYLISEFDADGFRLDVGDAVPADFWAEGRRRIQTIKEDAVLLNEGGDMQRLSYCYDANYGIEWEHGMYQVIQGEKTLEELRKEYDEVAARVPEGGIVLRALETHDTVTDWPRGETILGNDGMEMIQVMNYVMDGIPMVYCGNELADSAKLSMFANRFHMGKYEVTDREALSKKEYSIRRQSIIKKLNAWRKENKVVTHGNFTWLDEIFKDGVIAFKREYSGNAFVFIGNLTDTNKNLNIDLEIKNILFSNNMEISSVNLQLNKYGYIVAEV